jgi:hypothetical protein
MTEHIQIAMLSVLLALHLKWPPKQPEPTLSALLFATAVFQLIAAVRGAA